MIRCASRLENCCSCDYVAVYDGPSVNSRPLGKLCNNTLNFFQSSSTYITVLFRTDGSVTGRGFNAEFKSSLPPGAGQCRLQVTGMDVLYCSTWLNLTQQSHRVGPIQPFISASLENQYRQSLLFRIPFRKLRCNTNVSTISAFII